MEWLVEYTDAFEEWWDSLTEGEQEDVAAVVQLLELKGPQLPYPHSSGINGSKHDHMRELRIQHAGRVRTERSTLSTLFGTPSCCLAAIRLEMIAGTKGMCRWPTNCMTSTWKR